MRYWRSRGIWNITWLCSALGLEGAEVVAAGV